MRVQLIRLLTPHMISTSPVAEQQLSEWLRRFERQLEELPIHIRGKKRIYVALDNSVNSFGEEMSRRRQGYVRDTARQGYALLLNSSN